jgi:hypothetical protein
MQTRALPPIPPGERERVDRGLREALAGHLGAASAAQLRVTVSATLTHRVLVAEFRRGEESAVMMADYDAVESRPVRARPLLERTLLWEQDERILDAAASPETGEFWVLDAEYLTLRNRQGEVQRQSRVRREQPWPRDVRGRVAGNGRMWLPGDGSGPWPVAEGLDAAPAGENEFSLGTARFFTAARISPAVVLLSGVDGRLRWSEGGPARELEGVWGSDVTALANPCGGGTAVVIVSSRDGQSLNLFEPAARTLRPMGEGMTLPGMLSALWPAEGDAATAVVRTPAGRYAAYRIFAGCSR